MRDSIPNGVLKVFLREFEESAPGGIEEWGWGLTFAGTFLSRPHDAETIFL